MDDPDYGPDPNESTTSHGTTTNHLLKESDLIEGGRPNRFIVVNELTGKLSWFDSEDDVDDKGERVAPHWEGETWEPATEGKEANQPGLSFTGQPRASCLT